jgi:methyl-accepting chemotaxis protein
VQAQIAQRDISELLLQLVEQQQTEQEKLQQQSAEILDALQELRQSSTQAGSSPEPQALTISDASIDSLAEKVQAQIAQRDISELLLQLVEQQHAEQRQLQQQSNEILNALQEIGQSSSQLLDRSTAQSNAQPGEITISDASIDSLVEKVRAQLAQPAVERDISDILLQLIDQQHAEQEQLQQQSHEILSAIQQLALETREIKEPTIPDSSIEFLISRMQEQFAQQKWIKNAAESAIAEPAQTLEEILPSDDSSIIQSSHIESSHVEELVGIAYDRLRQVISQVEHHSQKLADSLHNSEQATTQISADAIRQVDELAYAIDSLQQLSASMQSAADVTSQVVSAAHTTSASSVTSNQAIEQGIQAISSLRTTIATTAKKVKRLGESSQHISKIAALIDDVAVRTNFLAINASLEASRAGNNGRGFANIAEEVGELATRSAAATKEIEELIDNIQSDSGEVIHFMELGTTQVVECTQLIEEAQHNLQQIAAASQRINQLTEPMSEVATSQTVNSGSITNLVQDIAQISKRTTNSSQKLSQSLQDTARSLEQLQLSVSQLEIDR